MATRVYFTNNVSDLNGTLPSAGIGNWDQNQSGTWNDLELDTSTGVNYDNSCLKTGSSAIRSLGDHGRFVSKSLDAVTLNHAVLKAQFFCYELEKDNDAYLSIAVGHCDADGSNATLDFHIDDDTEFVDGANMNAAVNRAWTASDQTNVSLSQGQRLIVEIGVYFNNTKNESDYAFEDLYGGAASDLPEDDSTGYSSGYNCWFETGDTFSEASGVGFSKSTSDTITVSEALNLAMQLGYISIPESLTISEIISAIMSMKADISSSLNLTELLSAIMSIKGNAIDITSIIEIIALAIMLRGNTADPTIIMEDVIAVMSVLLANTAESISIDESIEASMLAKIKGTPIDISNISEIISAIMSDLIGKPQDILIIVEAIQGLMNLGNISLTDIITLSEDTIVELEGILGDLEVDAADSVLITDIIMALMSGGKASPQDISNITETISAIMSMKATFGDTITISDIINGLMNLGIVNVQNAISIIENINSIMSLAGISISDSLGIIEDATLSIEGPTAPRLINILDAMNIIESIMTAMALGDVNISSITNISEAINARSNLGNISISDSVAITEQLQMILIVAALIDISGLMNLGNIEMNETIIPGEMIAIHNPLAGCSLQDEMNLSEYISIDIGELLYAAVKEFQALSKKFSFNGIDKEYLFSGQDKDYSFDGQDKDMSFDGQDKKFKFDSNRENPFSLTTTR